MSNNKYIISGQGFLKELTSGRIPTCSWTTSLKNAKSFTLNQAKGAIEYIKNNFESQDNYFIWSPFAETYEKDTYEVVRRDSFYSMMEETNYKVLEWYPCKSTAYSDFDHLKNLNENKIIQKYSYEEAVEIAKNIPV